MLESRRQAIQSLLQAAAAAGAGPWLARAALAQSTSARPTRGLEPFEIDFPPETIDDLNRRIDHVRWPGMPFETGWSTGTNDRVLKELVDYWRNEYDWFAVQSELNELDHLRGPIRGEQLHCVFYEAEGGSRADYPLLLLHGWPGSFHEFHEAAPRLASGVNGAPGFDVVVPSLPGYVLSQAPGEAGMTPLRIGERLHELMLELGYERYGVQGGDWGAVVATQMALRHPHALVALHLNFVANVPPPPDGVDPSPAEVAELESRAQWYTNEIEYARIQRTRPQTLTYAQHDSPVGWLAWMLEKYWAWSDHGDDLWETFSRDDVLTTASLYWLSGSILSAARLYDENANRTPENRLTGRVEVPTGYARFPKEPWGLPPDAVERGYNLVHYSEMPRGGHFPALEQPELWSNEVGRFFSGLGA